MVIDIVVPPALVAAIIVILEIVKAFVRIFGGDPELVSSTVWRVACQVLGFLGAVGQKLLDAGALPQTVEGWVAIVVFGWVVAMAAGKAYDETLGKARDAAKTEEEAWAQEDPRVYGL